MLQCFAAQICVSRGDLRAADSAYYTPLLQQQVVSVKYAAASLTEHGIAA
jgi:hypothetical protein